MRKYEVLYDWAIEEITRLTDSRTAEAYADGLEGPAEDEFISLSEKLRLVGPLLADAKAKRVLFEKWLEVSETLANFERQFSDFPDPVFRKFRLFVQVADKLLPHAADVDLNAGEIDGNRFEIRALEESLPFSWFTKENRTRIEDSLAIFDLGEFDPPDSEEDEVSPLHDQLGDDHLSQDFIFNLLAALASSSPPSGMQCVMIKKTADPIPDPAVLAFARLNLIISGKPIHLPKNYPHSISVIDKDAPVAGEAYHQLNDALDVASEYNERKSTLAKYLSLYHVFENFMFKSPLVELERKYGGNMFSIRDFRRLYREIEKSELSVLKRLFKEVFPKTAKPGFTYQQIVEDRWATYCPAPKINDLEQLLTRLNISKGQNSLAHVDFPGNESAGYFAQIVYAVRNVIVHNTETEWHLTNKTLDEVSCHLLEDFLMPCMEEIGFALMSTKNQHVWYDHETIALY